MKPKGKKGVGRHCSIFREEIMLLTWQEWETWANLAPSWRSWYPELDHEPDKITKKLLIWSIRKKHYGTYFADQWTTLKNSNIFNRLYCRTIFIQFWNGSLQAFMHLWLKQKLGKIRKIIFYWNRHIFWEKQFQLL